MKKFILPLLAVVMVMLSGCGGNSFGRVEGTPPPEDLVQVTSDYEKIDSGVCDVYFNEEDINRENPKYTFVITSCNYNDYGIYVDATEFYDLNKGVHEGDNYVSLKYFSNEYTDSYTTYITDIVVSVYDKETGEVIQEVYLELLAYEE